MFIPVRRRTLFLTRKTRERDNALDTALNLLYWDPVAVVLLAILAVVVLAEIIVTTVRSRVI